MGVKPDKYKPSLLRAAAEGDAEAKKLLRKINRDRYTTALNEAAKKISAARKNLSRGG